MREKQSLICKKGNSQIVIFSSEAKHILFHTEGLLLNSCGLCVCMFCAVFWICAELMLFIKNITF